MLIKDAISRYLIVSPKNAFKKTIKKVRKRLGGEGTVAADQVQGGHGHGEKEEGQKEKNLIFW